MLEERSPLKRQSLQLRKRQLAPRPRRRPRLEILPP
nr:MAG TPA: hypothetical protein [Caudoviricetes sp.]